MATEVILPKVDMDMATGRISRWHVEEGAVVKKGDLLFEIETDKAAMEIDAPASGTVRDITGKTDEDIAVGTAVAWIYGEGEARDAPPPSQAKEIVPAAESPPATGMSSQDRTGRTTPAREAPSSSAGAVRASPLARRLARDSGLDLAAIAGSGPHGRVVKADVEAAARDGGAGAAGPAPADKGAAAPAASPAAKPMSDDAILGLFEDGSYELVPHDGMRRTIARRLVEAKSTIPHFYLTLDCRIDALLALRKQLNDAAPDKDGKPAYKLSVNDLVIKAYALALTAVPDANVSWSQGGMLKHAHADVGVAVSIPGGLITPIIRAAEGKSLSSISGEMKDLAARARERKLKPAEYQGGTGAVSNLGMFGIRDFAAVINPPHATILAVGAGEERAVVDKGALAVANVMSVTLSTDHRAVDGALGAELLAEFRRLIENPMAMLV